MKTYLGLPEQRNMISKIPLSLNRLLLVAAGLLVTLHCAHQVAPGGGKPDESPPRIRSTVPMPGEVQVNRRRPIVFVFSEWIDPRSARMSVSMFPPPEDGFKVKVSGRRLEIVPKGPLAEATTYHLEITTALQDLRRNPFGTPYHLIFSTGDQLDSGEVSGCVIDPAKRVLQPKVALFEVHPDSGLEDTALFGMPSYLTQTDSSGRFALANIRPGTYETIAFVDSDNDNRLDPRRENQVYAPEQRRIQLDSTIEPLVLYPVLCDTTARTVLSVAPIGGTVIAGAWIRPARSKADSLREDSLRIVPLDTSARSLEIDRRIELPGERFLLALSDTLSLAPYGLVYPISFVIEPPDSIARQDTIRFNGVRFADTTSPTFTGWRPRSGARLLPHITLTWSEPVRLNTPRLAFADTLGDTVVATVDTTLTDTTALVPTRRFLPGRRYDAALPCSSVADLAGNHPTDTTDTCVQAITIITVQADDLCLSLAGRGLCLGERPNRRWHFDPLGAAAPATTADSAGHFRFDSLPAAKGTLAQFVDSNDDGRATAGNLLPWIAPEPYIPYYDTVEARARWDIEGVSVDACNPCRRGQEVRNPNNESSGTTSR